MSCAGGCGPGCCGDDPSDAYPTNSLEPEGILNWRGHSEFAESPSHAHGIGGKGGLHSIGTVVGPRGTEVSHRESTLRDRQARGVEVIPLQLASSRVSPADFQAGVLAVDLVALLPPPQETRAGCNPNPCLCFEYLILDVQFVKSGARPRSWKKPPAKKVAAKVASLTAACKRTADGFCARAGFGGKRCVCDKEPHCEEVVVVYSVSDAKTHPDKEVRSQVPAGATDRHGSVQVLMIHCYISDGTCA